jgi:hypothetical protein
VEGAGRRLPDCHQRRREPEHEADEHRHDQREGEHPTVDGDLGEARDPARSECQQGVDGPARQQETQHPADHRDRDGLGERLLDEAPPARAERGPHRELTVPRRGPNQEKVGHVGAGDQQDQENGAGQEKQRGADAAHGVLRHGDHFDAAAGVLHRILDSQHAGDR